MGSRLFRFCWSVLLLFFCACQNRSEDQEVVACRSVEHAQGTPCIPHEHQRLITLDGGTFEAAVALGLNPVGTVHSDLLDHVSTALAQTTDVGVTGEPSLEKILALTPDLMIGYDYYETIYPQLSHIAPTVLITFEHSGQWKDGFYDIAAKLNRTEKAQQVMDEYDQMIQLFQEKMQASYRALGREKPLVISVIRIYPDSINLYLRESFLGTILEDAGLSRPSSQDIGAAEAMKRFGNPIQTSISLELISQLDGDVIFIWTGQNTAAENQQAQEQLESLQANPLWQQLQAVQTGQVYQVPSYWIGFGPIAARAVLDDLFRYLIEEEE